jgi:hypothetical protein
MAIIGSTQFLERIQFFNGERLFASDLQALEAFNREMRWLHNQSLHQAGVGSGFQVTGNVGDRQVTVFPGYALDSCGREIVLTEPQVLPIPPVADNGSGGPMFYDLTVSYPSDTDLTPSETREGICGPAMPGVVRLREAPVFCWVRLSNDPTNPQPVDARLANRIKTALMIVLAQIQVFNCQLKQPVSAIQRRNARPAKQPRIGCGIQPSGNWSPPAAAGAGTAIGANGITFSGSYYQLSVQTASGGFQSTPFYSARLVGTRQFTTAATDPNGATPYFADALINILQSNPAPTATSFTIQIFPFYAASSTGSSPLASDITAAVQSWSVGWMGIES